MRFILTFLLTVLILTIPSTALAATLSLDPATGTLNKGCVYPIDVVIDTQGIQTDGTDAILFYDNSRFSINSGQIQSNNAIFTDFPGNNVDETTGKITVSGLASFTTPFSGRGDLATLQFTVKPEAQIGVTQIKFDFETGKTTDSNIVERTTISDALSSVVNGSYTIGVGPCPTPPTNQQATPSATAAKKKPVGGPYDGTPSATKRPVTIDDAVGGKTGTPELTFTLAIVGSVLTVLGILGLALL